MIGLYAIKVKTEILQKDDSHEIFSQKLGNVKAFHRIRIRSESLVDSAESEFPPNLLDSTESES